MTWTKTADFEAGNVTGSGGFNASSGTGLSVTTASKHAGTNGLSVAISDATIRYGSFTSLSTARVEKEFWFDPNSATFMSPTAIYGMMNGTYYVTYLTISKPTGTSNYVVSLMAVNTFRSMSDSANQVAYNVGSIQYPTITDAYHKFRVITKIRSASDWGSYYQNLPGGMSTVPDGVFPSMTYDSLLFIDDAFSASVSGKYSQEQGKLNETRCGILTTPATGTTGTVFFDDISWATNEGSVAVPTLLKTSINSNSVWTTPAYSTMIEGETGAFSLIWNGAGSVSAGTVSCYLNLSDNSAVNFPAGSTSASGNIQTSKAIAGLIGGNTYVLCFSSSIDGKTMMRQHRIKCRKPGEDL
jgi:hypothetical protein